MNPYHVPAMCKDCPLRREGGIRLSPRRIREISKVIAPADGQGAGLSCHKTTSASGAKAGRERQCVGALAYAERQGAATQLTRIMVRLHAVDWGAITAAKKFVWSSLRAWLADGAL